MAVLVAEAGGFQQANWIFLSLVRIQSVKAVAQLVERKNA